MTIEIKIGNILDSKENLICQQVNYQKVMGGGLALQIRNKWPEIYKSYCDFIDAFSYEYLKSSGYTHCFKINDNQFIVNIFGQEFYGSNKCYTDYISLRNAFNNINNICLWSKTNLENNISISIPDHIGCGLAGGDWDNVVWPMIQEIFGKSEIKVVIYKLEGEK